MFNIVLTIVVALTIGLQPVSSFYGNDYYNNRYGAHGIAYTSEDRLNGLWSDEGGLAGNYLYPSSSYSGDVCSGCTCDGDVVTTCSGSTVTLIGKNFPNITAGTFSETTTSITIMNCGSFELFEDRTFENLTQLQEILVQGTLLNHMPDLSATAVRKVNLANNRIFIDTNTHRGWTWPTTIEYIALMDNQLYWLPQNFVDGPNLRIASFANNQILQIQQSIFGDTSSLIYFGMDGNQITALSRNSIAPLATSNFVHLNISNNNINFIQIGTFKQFPNLKILEVHGNALPTISFNVFSNIPTLLHLDLHGNAISALPSKSFEDLPALMELRLHTQNPKMTSIAWDAWHNIGLELINLFVSDNALQTFPHQVLCEEDYPKLERIFADNNGISNATEYGSEAYPNSQAFQAARKRNTFTPFSTYTALHTMYLHGNLITHLTNTDLCNMTNLQNLYISGNQLTEDTIDDDAFKCLAVLDYLDIGTNNIQYVPNALKSSDVLQALTTLVMPSNHLTFLEAGTFTNLSTLTTLTLSNNKIIAVENGVFNDGIETLHLDGNDFRFTHKYPFTNLANLRTLWLNWNEIDYIPADAFANCTSLAEIQMAQNNIPQLLQSHFQNCPLSGDILFNNNDIGYIEDGTFAHLTFLTRLTLADNKLTRLPTGGDFHDLTIVDAGGALQGTLDFSNNRIVFLETDTFKNLVINDYISFANNKITVIMKEAFNGLTASNLDLRGNLLREIQEKAFTSLTLSQDLFLNNMFFFELPTYALYGVSARTIYIDHGNITTINNEAFYDVVVSENLDLSNNQLGSLTGPLFGGTSSVGQYFYLNYNSLTGMSSDAFDNVNLGYVYLAFNSLTVYPNTLLSQNPSRIYINDNLLYWMIPDGSFAGQSNLEQLHLSNNNLSFIQTGLLDPVTALQYLYLDNNNVDRIPENIFDTMTNLQYIYMQNNALTHFPALTTQPVKTVDVSNNVIETFGKDAFSGLTSFSSLDITGNPLACSCELVSTMNDVASAITGGECQSPSDASGITFGLSTKDLNTYFLSTSVNNASWFQCSATNVVATAVSGSEITVTWDQPTLQYFQTNSSVGSSPTLDGSVTYQVSCDSDTASPLYDTQTDADTTAGATSFSQTFNTGVVGGTTYDCSIKMVLSGFQSAKSTPSTVVTPDAATNPGVAGPNDVVLSVKYYDFSKVHTDFSDIAYPSITAASYVDSPYGAWLSASTTPLTDTFSTWFRSDPSVNHELSDTIILAAQSGTIKQYSSESFFPVDGLGFLSEQQIDCGGTYHNFGFTTAVRAGIKFAGTEKITIGGGEALWLFINKVKIVEFVANENLTQSCFYIDLSPAATSGGGTISPQQGTLSSGTCTGLSSAGNTATLELQANEIYHFDLFHVESRRCRSIFLFQVEDTTFSLDPTTELPLDYGVTIAEDFYVDDIVETVNLIDVFSTGPYVITLYSGNENRLFEFKENTAGNQFTAPAAVAPTYTTIVDIDGNSVSYVECNGTTTTTLTTNSASETFSISTTSALLTLKSDLDYEATTSYYFLLRVEDTGNAITGSVGIRVYVSDINDNCPVISPTTVTMTPLPVLVDWALVNFTTTDADSGVNADITYIVSAVTADPPVNYSQSLELWNNIYLNYTVLTFDVLAIDNGTIPHGATASLNVTVSNTCVMDVQFGDIQYIFSVNETTGGMTLRIPKYYVVEFLCLDDVGIARGLIPDAMMTASSSFDESLTGPGRGRVNQTENVYNGMEGAWIAATQDLNQYLEVDMVQDYKFTQVHIQGRADADEWVTSFKIFYYNETSTTWIEYTDNTGQNVFVGTYGRNDINIVDLNPSVFSQKIRINPQSWNGGNISLRIDFSGCEQAEQLYYDVSCVRCEATNYCEGEGIQKPCGRCDPYDPTSTCGRNPVEHTFGHASECTTCPDGWICKDGYATPCAANHYVECNSTWCPDNCTQCETGYACHGGQRTICSPGYYSDGTYEICAPCEPNTYQDQNGSSSCVNCPAGYYAGTAMSSCAQCLPEEYSTGDGTGCQACSSSADCPCMTGDKCFNGTGCYNIGSGSYLCNACPAGFSGDGHTCVDIDECTDNNPCFNSRCINTEPGYQCLECPEGYSGTFEDAYSWGVHQRVFVFGNTVLSNFSIQTCDDIDECATNHGGCDARMPCVNTAGSYYCDFCETGYIGTNKTGCYLDNFCISGAHDCNSGANCIYLGPAQFRCECKPGYAGNGEACETDSDNDGHPDKGASCTEWGCYRDNCVSVSNSNQEDADGDNQGDNCDSDDDNDGRYDYLDNCQFVSNWDQSDTDGDGVGDVCDNCASDSNSDQADNDGDGTGDVCDTDDDDDGVLDVSDNCPFVANAGQENTGDSDSVGDACDNCVNVDNDAQTDTDQNGVGDACDTVGGTNKDEDGDSILDFLDNCSQYPNADQSDIDGDGTGDLCDTDTDGDGVVDGADNCPYLSNAGQSDVDGDGVGDDCETDTDGDGVIDKNDTCPYNPSLSVTSFADYFTVDLDPSLTVTTAPSWRLKGNGAEVQQSANTEMPTMLIGQQSYGAIRYAGTWFTTDSTATEYFGCVFGYVSNRKFYVVMWKGTHYNYGNTTYKAGIKGVQLKVVNSNTGPGSTMAQAIWHSYDTSGETTLIWQDPDLQGWLPETSYRWFITHQPSNGYINIQIYQGATLMVDSGSLYDSTISGGRVGVLQFGQFPVIWANLRVDCQDHLNQALYFDGIDDYVTLDDLQTLKMNESFTVETWLKLDSGYTSGPYPILCTLNGSMCLWVENAQVQGRYSDWTVASASTLSGDTWYNLMYRYSVEDQTIAVFIDGVQQGITYNVIAANWTLISWTNDLTMYIGRQNETYFRGTIDEVRVYSVAVPDTEITSHISLVTLQREIWKDYGVLHFRMEEASGVTNLTNHGIMTSGTSSLNGGTFVTSFQQFHQFAITYPNNK